MMSSAHRTASAIALIVAGTPNPGRTALSDSEHHVPRLALQKSEDDVAQFTIVNHGNRVAHNVGIESEYDLLRFLGPQQIGEIAPGQVVQVRALSLFPLEKYEAKSVRFRVTVNYEDRLDNSRKFQEKNCFEGRLLIGYSDDDKRIDVLTEHEYNPALKLEPCSGLGIGWSKK